MVSRLPPNSAAPKALLVYADDCAYFLNSIQGWEFSTDSKDNDGMPLVYFPHGGSWENSDAVMYTKADQKDHRTLQQYIAEDIKSFKQNNPHLIVTAMPSPKELKANSVAVEQYRHLKGSADEAVAYIECPKAFVIICLSSRTDKTFKASEPAFKKLVQSFKYVSDKVKIERSTSTSQSHR